MRDEQEVPAIGAAHLDIVGAIAADFVIPSKPDDLSNFLNSS